MRLKDSELAAIKSTIENFDNSAEIYIFGSRVDNTKRGGDIDILIMSTMLTGGDKRAIKAKLYELLGEQKIDILIAADNSNPFVRLALGTGVKL